VNKKPKITLVNYQTNNLFSIQQACSHVGSETEIASDWRGIEKAEALILPGVGAFGDAMKNLNRLGMSEAIKDFVSSGRPLMGICLGLQMLFSESEEFGVHHGLGLIPGKVIRFSGRGTGGEVVKVPHTGWSRIYEDERGWEGTPMGSLENGEYMYFVHSFYVVPGDTACTISKTSYGGVEYCSAILSDNIFATQFHPEKSGEAGLSIYRQWINTV
jgi:glutamine amidotransferase